MHLTVLNSDSKGNSYIFQNDTEALILELGVNFQQVKKALKYNLDKVVGCAISHNHGDHAKFVGHALRDYLPVIMTKGTKEALKVEDEKIKIIKHMQKIKMGNFSIVAFDVNHDVPEPVGFIIDHAETGRICFITDSMFMDYRFPGVNNFMIEANYCNEVIKNNVKNGSIDSFRYQRTLNSHMSIDTCNDFLQQNDLTAVNNILLIHLSDKNSDPEGFKNRIERTTGKTVTIAKKGLVMDFNKYPF